MMKFSRFSYHKLKQDKTSIPDDNEVEEAIRRLGLQQQQQPSSNLIFSNTVIPTKQQQLPQSLITSRSRRRRRWGIRVSGLRRFFSSSKNNNSRRRRRRRPGVKMIWAKIVQRLKESREHFGEIFAGNYLFLQVAPDYPFNNSSKSYYCSNKYNTYYYSQKKLPLPSTTTVPNYLSKTSN